ncbi:hypothetical protein FEM48_Zijuj11G0119200 [Ziziphus jujuba var. spinosa]|uniref:PLAC8 motif-containing protein n=1 Tax=Ziziphus jujuba var. spinosa TaxID=714518 RepID=A0A978UIS9_ZIZJJ|nr:hypothetical protein FEM48_Zijuj11G0119200 [Ziziphus jujuba var. spinosa]
MTPTISTGSLTEVREELSAAQQDYKMNGKNAFNVSMERGLLIDESPRSDSLLSTNPSQLRLQKYNSTSSLTSPSEKYRKTYEESDAISCSVPSSAGQGFCGHVHSITSKKIDWGSMNSICKKWIKDPLNMVLLLWIVCVAVSGAILFLVMTGMLNGVLPKKSQRNVWFEVNNQILNALFTLMCLYQHPKRFHHLVLLIRWKPKDVTTLREMYCKNGTKKPHERAHIMVVIVLLHVNCFAQYALCGLNWGYKRSERPAAGVGISLSVAIAGAAIAGVYTMMSPLGKEYDLEVDEEAQDQILINTTKQAKHLGSFERRFSFASRNEHMLVEHEPEWNGGLFDIGDDFSVAYFSLFCCICLFGWNMERLGFGNMYVHIATFFLFCSAPFWIFNLAAVNIDNETIREALGLTGIVLCVFGLLYGGFWRIQMRKRFNLPANNLCCGKPAITDCVDWLFCCWCSLAQEVRTAGSFDTVKDKICRKQTQMHSQPALSPLPREDGAIRQFRSIPSSLLRNSPQLSKLGTESSQNPSTLSKDYCSPGGQLDKVEGEVVGNFMNPPIPSTIQREYFQ